MAMLAATGIPVEGERGLGYVLRTPLALPPMILTPEELEALLEGLRIVGAGDISPKSRAARALLYRVTTLLPQAGISPELPPD
jgi:predicted DNA-binding transcriptional regulator YafY